MTKRDATVEVAVRLGVDPGEGRPAVRGTVSRPYGTGKTVRWRCSRMGHRSALEIGTAALVTVALALQVSWYYLEIPAEIGPPAEVWEMTTNINRGQADAASFVDVAETNADSLCWTQPQHGSGEAATARRWCNCCH